MVEHARLAAVNRWAGLNRRSARLAAVLCVFTLYSTTLLKPYVTQQSVVCYGTLRLQPDYRMGYRRRVIAHSRLVLSSLS